MLNAIFLGLSALSSITGFASGINYNTTTEDLNNVSRFICENKNIEVCEFNKLDKIYFNDLYTISGENRYIEVVFDNGYVIYDKNYNKRKRKREPSPFPFFLFLKIFSFMICCMK